MARIESVMENWPTLETINTAYAFDGNVTVFIFIQLVVYDFQQLFLFQPELIDPLFSLSFVNVFLHLRQLFIKIERVIFTKLNGNYGHRLLFRR